ncbi:MAG TPA: hypothetical protein VLN57_20950 [Xanthobacteraceae bacterium]|nr:hypothetical protein [Xanthobacteraceae bacterium]
MKINLYELERKAVASAEWTNPDGPQGASPSETLALIARVRELEKMLTILSDEIEQAGDDPNGDVCSVRIVRELVANGTILP